MSEKIKPEVHLQNMQKLESLGLLAGGIAHDFNNLLTAISGNIALAKQLLKNDMEAFAILSDAEVVAHDAKILTQQLLTFSKGGSPVKRVVSIKELLADPTPFIVRPSAVKVHCSIADDIWQVEADDGQIVQVLNNLITNADQAMPEGGNIEISARNILIDSSFDPALTSGEYVQITIKDHGVGIPKENLSKIFDPYFTTKRAGGGLGLATSYSIINKHGGTITVETELAKGTSFSLYLPASKNNATEPATDAVQHKEGFAAGKGKVLVMDDEESIRRMVGRMLNHLGYEGSFAKEGSEAIEIYKSAKEAGKSFDLVMLDLTVPAGLGGKETIAQLKKIDPAVKAIVFSGYSADPVMANYGDFGFLGSVSKPCSIEDLSLAIRSVIGTTP